ncbi:MAG: RNA polymerase sigma factor [Planctomycetota bacterium]|jgi:RNA polymerase sigma-70 factor (ECF subfamily)
MLEDKALVWQLKHGNIDALRRIYEKYKHELLALAITLLSDKSAAEDVVHDVFVSFAGATDKLELRRSLRSYLLTCVANRVRNLGRTKSPNSNGLEDLVLFRACAKDSSGPVIRAEQSRRISEALDELPYHQREVIVLHLQSGMKFKDIAFSQGVSINTAQARYRYGLDKLRSLLDGEVEK